MSIDCHTSPTEAGPGAATEQARPSGRVPEDALLDAARDCVLSHGVRRTTLTQIARTAGVSRMTLYRRFPDVTSALAALMTREFGEVLRGIRTAGVPADARTRLVLGTVEAVRALTIHPLLRAVLDKDAEVVLPYIVERLGTTQRHAEAFIAEQIAAGHADGSIRTAEPRAQTRSVLLIAQSFTLSMRPASTDVSPDHLLSELEHALECALLPPKENS